MFRKTSNDDTMDIKKPTPRRLYSSDSNKSSTSSIEYNLPRGPRPMNRVVSVDEEDEKDRNHLGSIPETKEHWIAAEPTSLLDHTVAWPPVTQELQSKLEPVRQPFLEPVRSSTPTNSSATATALPSSKLWENLRHHVLPSSVRPSTPTQQGSRSGTPKPSRFAKISSFKQLVDDARSVDADTRKFGEEILRACGVARYGEVMPTRESVINTATSGGAAGGWKLDYLRRPHSVSSVPSSSQTASPPSFRYLYQILVSYSEGSNRRQFSTHFPHEDRLLSTLLSPFLFPTPYPVLRLDEEQITAVDAFELLSRSWPPTDGFAFTNRCLWCTKAAASLSPQHSRTRILASLSKLLDFSAEGTGIQVSVENFRSLCSGLLLLLASLRRPPTLHEKASRLPLSAPRSSQLASVDLHADVYYVQQAIHKVLSGSVGELDENTVASYYNAEYTSADRTNSDAVRHAIFTDALLDCIENTPAVDEWMIHGAIEEYWLISANATFSTLQGAICSRRLNTFSRISRAQLWSWLESPLLDSQSRRASSSSTSSSLSIFDIPPNARHCISRIVSILQTRVIPESEAIDDIDGKLILETRVHITQVLLDLTCLKDPGIGPDVFGGPSPANMLEDLLHHVKWAIQTFSGWYRAGTSSPWRAVLETTLQRTIMGEWQTSVPILLSLLNHLPDDIRKTIFSTLLPAINDRLANEPPPYPYPELSLFLLTLSQTLPTLFYKPLFACAASDKEVVVVNYLCTIQVHAKYVQDYWIRDPEMMCVALLSDTGMAAIGAKDGKWGVARLGQLVLLVELIGKLQQLRHERDNSSNSSDTKLHKGFKFVLTLENRMWGMIAAKEQKILFPPSQRMLFCMVLREFRLLTRSLKPAPWLTSTVKWFDDFCADDYLGNLEQEVTESVERVQGLYMAAQAGVQQIHKRHTSILTASVVRFDSDEADKQLDLAATFVQHRKLIDSLSKGYIPRAMKLFVALSTLLSEEDYCCLGPLLWRHCLLDNAGTSSTTSACFLLMHCAEKTTMDLLPAIEIDLHASDDMTRLEAVRKIGILVNWRFQLLTQNFLTDRTHRPFKLGRPPLPFVATDIGSGFYIPVEEVEQNKEDDVPKELRKRLEELGFKEEDATEEDPRHELIMTPLSILPLDQMDRMEVGVGDVFGGSSSPKPSPRRFQHKKTLQLVDESSALLRRNSSSGGPVGGLKRRAVFVPSLSFIFHHLATLVFDSNFTIASAARITILDLMRSDPALLTRSLLDQLAGENKDTRFAMSTLSALIHVRHTLPPSLTHYIFNNLAGFLKYVAKNPQTPDTLDDFGQMVPIITSLAIQVSGMSMREIRRSKMEHIFIPSGSLWFPLTAPKGSMFPRSLGPSKTAFDLVPAQLFSITMVRASQNLFFLSMLKRNFKDVQAIRKSMSQLELPSLDEHGSSKNLELRDFVPRHELPDTRPPFKRTVDILSLMLSRSYILLVAQIFRSMPRHLSDRHELAVLIDGLNRCLLAHGDDINIVSQVLIALMVASTRFRRLFMTGGGYTLFMPALVKVYLEQPAHPGIRAATEYAVSRFYALHKESFLYQSVHIIGQLAMLPEVDQTSFSKGVFDIFNSLGKAATSIDIAGIHNVNKAEERDAFFIHAADETPQTFLAAIRRGDSKSGLQMDLQIPEEYENPRLSMDDFVRLLLTVIAHDLTISRAQHFLRLLRFLSPHLHNSSTQTRSVLVDGIEALASIFTKAFSKPKGGGELPKPIPESEDESFLTAGPGLENLVKEKTRTPSDSVIMRVDFLQLVLTFGQSERMVSPVLAQQVIDITRSLLKDWAEAGFQVIASFLSEFVKMMLIREEAPPAKLVVSFLHGLAPILHAFMSVEFSGVFGTILRILPVPIYGHDATFAQVVVGEICSAGLAACDLAASENRLMKLTYRPTFIYLLAEAIFLRDADIIGELVKRPPTYHFLSGIVLPLALAMKTGAQIIDDSTRNDFHRRALNSAWVRLLFYAITACQKSRRDADQTSNSKGSFRSKSVDDRKSDDVQRTHLSTYATALQVIKVVVVRAADDIASVPRLGVWERVGNFLQSMLTEGNANFALRPDLNSAATTPAGSPRSSSQFEPSTSNSGYNLFVSTSSGLITPGSPRESFFPDGPRSHARPSLIDYCLWSVLEFVCAYRSPLRMQLKLLVMEKVLAIDHELQQGSRTASTPYPSSPSIRRISASIGSGARKRASARGVPSPDSSPYLSASSSNLSPSPSTPSPRMAASPSMLEIPPINQRRPGYTISPVTPQERAPGWPKIVHLGPTSPSALLPTPPPMIGLGIRRDSRVGPSRVDTSTASKATKVKSPFLIQETYRRIRGIQTFMGYTLLLPLPVSDFKSMGMNDEEVTLPVWTKSQALASIMQETNSLLDEFDGTSDTLQVGEGITVEIEPSTPARADTP